MKIKKYLFLIAVIFSVTSCRGQDTGNSLPNGSQKNDSSVIEKFESKEGGYKIMFPCVPAKSEKPIDSDFGSKKIYFYSCGDEANNFSVSYQDFTKKIGSPKEIFDYEKHLLTMGIEESATIISENEKEVGGFPAFDFETELNASDVFPSSGFMNEFHVIKGQRHYTVFAGAVCKNGQKPKDIKADFESRAKQFIDSFELVESK